jgi:hypothetical protein
VLARASSPMLVAPPPFSVYVSRHREAAQAPRRFARVAIAAIVLGLGFAGGALVLEETCGDTAPGPQSALAPATRAATPPVTARTAPAAPARPAPPPARVVATPIAAPAPAPAGKPDTIQLAVTTQPAGATVVLDGVRLGTTPFTASVPAKAAQGWLKVRMHGWIAVKTRVSLEHDVQWNVALRPLSH